MKRGNIVDIDKMRLAGRKLAEVMTVLAREVKPGVSTKELDFLAEREIRARGCQPAFLGYGAENGTPFPATICASVNDEVVHGIPKKETILRAGDIFSADMGLIYRGHYADMARTFAVGEVSSTAEKLIAVTKESFFRGIKNLRAGTGLFDYAGALQDYVEENGFGVVRQLVSHGIGRELHTKPQIPNYRDKKFDNFEFFENMTVALEPMVTAGDWRVKLADDGWTFVTVDGSLAAHYENTVLITVDGVEILTDCEV